MAEKTVLYKFNLKPGHCVEVGGFIPKGCTRFSINLGKDEKNLVLHFNPRFDEHKIILNSRVDNVFGEELKESVFPYQEGSDIMVCFLFQQDKITIELGTGSILSFPLRFPIEEISYLSLVNLQLKSLTLN
ncbi:galectin-1-like [Lithobates pipiens]